MGYIFIVIFQPIPEDKAYDYSFKIWMQDNGRVNKWLEMITLGSTYTSLCQATKCHQTNADKCLSWL